MYETTRGIATLVGAAVAGFLIWLAVQVGGDSAGEFWASYGLIAAAGLTMALSQVLGGWTKWGWPRLSPGVFLLAFVPVAIVTLWLLFSRQPGDSWLNTGSWSDDVGLGALVSDLGELLAPVAFGAGLVLGFTFDTAGPTLRPEPGYPVEQGRFDERPDPAYVDRGAADEPLTAERRSDAEPVDEVDEVDDVDERDRPPRRVIRP